MSEESAKPLESILNRAVEEKKQQVKGSLEARLKKSWERNNFDQKGGKGESASKGKDIPHPGPAPSMKWWKLCLGACAGSQEWDWGEIWFAIKTFDILNKGILLSQKKHLAVPKKAGLSKFIHLQSKSQDHLPRCLIRWSSSISFLRGPQPFYRLRVCGWTVSNEEYINVFFQPNAPPLAVVLRRKKTILVHGASIHHFEAQMKLTLWLLYNGKIGNLILRNVSNLSPVWICPVTPDSGMTRHIETGERCGITGGLSNCLRWLRSD